MAQIQTGGQKERKNRGERQDIPEGCNWSSCYTEKSRGTLCD